MIIIITILIFNAKNCSHELIFVNLYSWNSLLMPFILLAETIDFPVLSTTLLASDYKDSKKSVVWFAAHPAMTAAKLYVKTAKTTNQATWMKLISKRSSLGRLNDVCI